MSHTTSEAPALTGRRLLLGVTGGIAAYKACELVRRLRERGAEVQVVMTENATRFVGPPSFRALSGRRVITDMWQEPETTEISHVALSDWTELMVIAPATADFVGKMAAGLADDMLSTTIVAAASPVLLAPAMNARMWANPIVQRNVETLRSRGYLFVGPEEGRLASGAEGTGRLAEVAKIIAAVESALAIPGPLAGRKVIVTAGPTREPIDAVRFISNPSSGKMGYAFATEAARLGAEVVLVAGPTALPDPPGVRTVHVTTAAQMHEAVMAEFTDADVVVGAAAPADYAPAEPAPHKVPKQQVPQEVRLVPTPDILADLGRRKKGQILVGMAAETDDVITRAREKLQHKNLDLILANDVSQPGAGFEADTNQITIIPAHGDPVALPLMPKSQAAARVWEEICNTLSLRKERR